MFDPARYIGMFSTVTTQVSLAGGTPLVARPNSNRVYLSLLQSSGTTTFVANDANSPTLGGVWPLPSNVLTEFHWARHGALVTYGFYVQHIGAGANLWVYELIFRPDQEA